MSEKFFHMKGLLADVICYKKYSTRLQYAEHFTEGCPHLFLREVNDSVERYNAGDRLVFKFERKNISFSEMNLWMDCSCLFQYFFR